MFSIVVCNNYEDVCREAFSHVRRVMHKRNPVLGLATGSTPLGLYKKMIEDHNVNGTTYRGVISFNLDEYLGLPEDHPQSYHRFMQDNLFSSLDILPENTHVPNGNAEDMAAECAAYEKMLDENVVDLQILGIGANGHIGFNEPGTSFDSVTHVVELTDQTRSDNARFFANDKGKVPEKAVTMGLSSIIKARRILIIATGRNKAKAVAGLVQKKPDPSCPASILQNHNNVTVILDKDAASMLMI